MIDINAKKCYNISQKEKTGDDKMAYISGVDRNQLTLEPISLEDYVSENNVCRVIDAYVKTLDLKSMGFKYAQTSPIGRPPYDPADMVKLYVYGYLNKIRSSRRLETETHRNLELMWLMSNLTPDDKTICNFRKDNPKPLKKLFHHFNEICLKLSLFGRETVAIDGSKFKADNGRKNCHTEKSVKETLTKLETKVTAYLKELEENDVNDSDEATVNANRIQEALTHLRERTVKMEGLLKEIKANDGQAVCTVDKEAELMKQGNGNGFDVCFNAQTAVDEKHGLVVDFEVTDSCNDINELSSMAIEAKAVLHVDKLNVVADTGYSNGAEINKCEENEITTYIPKPRPSHQPKNANFHRNKFIYDPKKDVYTCPAGNEMSRQRVRERDGFIVYSNRCACMNCPVKDQCTKSKTLREIERSPYEDKVNEAASRAKANPAIYRRRQELSEHPFGVIKSVWGFGQFLCRGKEKTTGEAALAFLAFNLRRVITILKVEPLIKALATQ
jgi:transposase